jgi:hypothetical protein
MNALTSPSSFFVGFIRGTMPVLFLALGGGHASLQGPSRLEDEYRLGLAISKEKWRSERLLLSKSTLKTVVQLMLCCQFSILN